MHRTLLHPRHTGSRGATNVLYICISSKRLKNYEWNEAREWIWGTAGLLLLLLLSGKLQILHQNAILEMAHRKAQAVISISFHLSGWLLKSDLLKIPCCLLLMYEIYQGSLTPNWSIEHTCCTLRECLWLIGWHTFIPQRRTGFSLLEASEL